jgi:RNA polymerase sigma-70 factor (ECF subfamily)
MPSEHPATIERLRQGDRAAFDQLYERYAPRIHGFLLRLVRDPAVADDLAQDTWLAFARATPSLKDGSDLAALLFTISAGIQARRGAAIRSQKRPLPIPSGRDPRGSYLSVSPVRLCSNRLGV